MIEIDWKKYYTHEEFKTIFRSMIEKSKKDFKSEIEDLNKIKQELYA
jgi:hypothetical protein